MHPITRWASLIVLGILLPVTQAGAQQRTADVKTAILTAVMRYRLYWIADPTVFDACRAFQVAGLADGLPVGTPQPIQQLLDRPVEDCGRAAATGQRGGLRRVVVVDSLAVGDSISHAFLTVHQGENIHRENYVLRTPASEPGFASVRTVTLWGGIQVYQAPRPPSRPRR